MNKKAIAIFGGSFNPPLNSHTRLAKQVLEEFKEIERIIFVPVSIRYKKEALIEDIHRYNMLKIVCSKVKEFEVSDMELNSENRMYTIETLNSFKKIYPEHKIYFIMGSDNLKEFETWSKPETILENYKVIILERGEDSFNKIIKESIFLRKYKNSLIRLKNIEKINLSSTIIREKIKNKEDVKDYIDEKVLEYIKEHKLY